MKLNWNLNTETPNGRFYDKQHMLNEFNRLLNEKRFFVYLGLDTSLNNLFGVVESFNEEDGTVVFDVSIIKREYAYITDEVSIRGVGFIDEDGNSVSNFMLENLFLTSGEKND